MKKKTRTTRAVTAAPNTTTRSGTPRADAARGGKKAASARGPNASGMRRIAPEASASKRTLFALTAAVSSRLRAALQNRPVSEVAHTAGCSPATVRRYLSGEGVPTVAFVIAVSVVYDLSAQWLLTGRGRVRRFGRPRRS